MPCNMNNEFDYPDKTIYQFMVNCLAWIIQGIIIDTCKEKEMFINYIA